jgi:hypothetical protein
MAGTRRDNLLHCFAEIVSSHDPKWLSGRLEASSNPGFGVSPILEPEILRF